MPLDNEEAEIVCRPEWSLLLSGVLVETSGQPSNTNSRDKDVGIKLKIQAARNQ